MVSLFTVKNVARAYATKEKDIQAHRLKGAFESALKRERIERILNNFLVELEGKNE
jgi:hypothetical protein